MSLIDALLNAPVLTTAGAAAASAAGVYLYAAKVETRKFRLEKLPAITIGGIYEPTGRRLRVLHLSDLHLCAPESHKLAFLKQIPVQQFDLVAVTGDIFENPSGLQYAKDILAGRPKYGAYAVLGNHDYYDYTWLNKTYGRIDRKYRHPKEKRNVQPFVDALAEAGITALRNEAVTVNEAGLHVVGIDYPGAPAEVVEKLVHEAPPGSLILALQHVPHKLNYLVDAGVHFAFAGHTHGGQVRLPGVGALITDSELPPHEASGLVLRRDTTIHVSRGLGADPKSNFRLFCPPAATELDLLY